MKSRVSDHGARDRRQARLRKLRPALGCVRCGGQHASSGREECQKLVREAKLLVDLCRFALGLEPLYSVSRY